MIYKLKVQNNNITIDVINAEYSTEIENEKLGEGGFGNVYNLAIEYVDDIGYNKKHFVLSPKVDLEAVIKIYKRGRNSIDFGAIEDNLSTIAASKQCREHFIPTVLLTQDENKYLIMKKALPVNLWVNTDKKLSQVIAINACMKKHFIVSKRIFVDFKHPNLAEYNKRIVFLDTEDFANIEIATKTSVYGYEVDDKNVLVAAHEKKIIIWIFFMYMIYKYKVYIKTGDYVTGFEHIMGITKADYAKLKEISDVGFSIDASRLPGNLASQNISLNAAAPKYVDGQINPLYFTFIDVIDSNNDTFNQYRMYLVQKLIPNIEKVTKENLNAWKKLFGAPKDEDVTIDNLYAFVGKKAYLRYVRYCFYLMLIIIGLCIALRYYQRVTAVI